MRHHFVSVGIGTPLALAACRQTSSTLSSSDDAGRANASTAVLTGTATHVRDGDTIEVAGVPIRFNGVTCDERETSLGNQVTARRRQIVAVQTIEII